MLEPSLVVCKSSRCSKPQGCLLPSKVLPINATSQVVHLASTPSLSSMASVCAHFQVEMSSLELPFNSRSLLSTEECRGRACTHPVLNSHSPELLSSAIFIPVSGAVLCTCRHRTVFFPPAPSFTFPEEHQISIADRCHVVL